MVIENMYDLKLAIFECSGKMKKLWPCMWVGKSISWPGELI